MSAKDKGGPAFPLADSCCEYGGTNRSDANGMTLRDYFAAKAMPQVLREWSKNREEHDASADFESDAPMVAADCYIMADAMLEARKK